MKVQQAASQVSARKDDVNRANNETLRLASNVSQVVSQWDTWLDRADTAQLTIDEMASQAEMTSSQARDMLEILADFDARSQGWRTLGYFVSYCALVQLCLLYSFEFLCVCLFVCWNTLKQGNQDRWSVQHKFS